MDFCDWMMDYCNVSMLSSIIVIYVYVIIMCIVSLYCHTLPTYVI